MYQKLGLTVPCWFAIFIHKYPVITRYQNRSLDVMPEITRKILTAFNQNRVKHNVRCHQIHRQSTAHLYELWIDWMTTWPNRDTYKVEIFSIGGLVQHGACTVSVGGVLLKYHRPLVISSHALLTQQEEETIIAFLFVELHLIVPDVWSVALFRFPCN